VRELCALCRVHDFAQLNVCSQLLSFFLQQGSQFIRSTPTQPLNVRVLKQAPVRAFDSGLLPSSSSSTAVTSCSHSTCKMVQGGRRKICPSKLYHSVYCYQAICGIGHKVSSHRQTFRASQLVYLPGTVWAWRGQHGGATPEIADVSRVSSSALHAVRVDHL
jgi:hypothetical protein